jgi:CRISPR-associated DxTHG motif protein
MATRLITTLGTGAYHRSRYYLEGQPALGHETAYAPVAAAVLLGGIQDARLLLTPEAQQRHEAPCRAELERLGVAVQVIEVPPGRNSDELWQLFDRVRVAAEGAESVVLDVTHGFRHLPFVLFGALTYLTALRRLQIRAIVYGAFESSGGNGVPVFDLTSLLRAVDWYHGVRLFVETGHPGPLTRLMRHEAKELFERLGRPGVVAKLIGPLDELHQTLPVALPLEGGLAARRVLAVLADLRGQEVQGAVRPVVLTLLDSLERALGELAVEVRPDDTRTASASTGLRPASKTAISLDLGELERELRVARWYLDRGQPDRTVCILREWILNRWIVANGRAAEWLDYPRCRRLAEQMLNAWAERRRAARGSEASGGSGGTESAEDAGVPGLWEAVATWRNRLAHYGFTAEAAPVAREKVQGWLARCVELCGNDAAWRSPVDLLTEHLLVAPLGWRPGALYTALLSLRPSSLVVVTSREAKRGVEDACRTAGWAGGRLHVIEVADAHDCFGERARVLDAVRPLLLAAGRVSVSLTGGTTAMQYLAERVAAEAARLGVPVARYAMLDRRSEDEQRRQPFLAGECVRLDEEAPDDHPASEDLPCTT